MRYYVEEIRDDAVASRNAASKARRDVNDIFAGMGMQLLPVRRPGTERKIQSARAAKLLQHVAIADSWRRATAPLKRGDELFVQFPSVEHSLFLAGVFRALRRRGVRVVLHIHDLEMLRSAKSYSAHSAHAMRILLEEKKAIAAASGIIAHNETMVRFIEQAGGPKGSVVPLGIFDYLIPDVDAARMAARDIEKEGPVLIAGNLICEKAGYAYHLPQNQTFALYGINYTGQVSDTVQYRGSFAPNDLPYHLSGSFGLVWDGSSAHTCEGIFGAYLQINNPHKTSLYLASGLPVIIWDQAALGGFVTAHHCGITVASLADIAPRIEAMTKEEYDALRKGAAQVSEQLRAGAFLTAAVERVESSWQN